MGIFYQPEKFNLQALEETLRAAELLLPTYDLDNRKNKPLFEGQERMGIPAAILIFSFIESVGHLTQKRSKCQDSFAVLQENWFNKIAIEQDQWRDLYRIYRSKLTHNMMLPLERLIDCAPDDPTVFLFSSDAKNVTWVNLYALLQKSKQALLKIKENNHKLVFQKSTTLANVLKNILKPSLKIISISPSGVQKID